MSHATLLPRRTLCHSRESGNPVRRAKSDGAVSVAGHGRRLSARHTRLSLCASRYLSADRGRPMSACYLRRLADRRPRFRHRCMKSATVWSSSTAASVGLARSCAYVSNSRTSRGRSRHLLVSTSSGAVRWTWMTFEPNFSLRCLSSVRIKSTTRRPSSGTSAANLSIRPHLAAPSAHFRLPSAREALFVWTRGPQESALTDPLLRMTFRPQPVQTRR